MPRLWWRLSPRLRLRAPLLLVLMVVNSLFEMISIGAVVPAAALIVDPASIQRFTGLDAAKAASAWLARADVVSIAMVALLLLFGIKSFFQFFVARQIWEFARALKVELAQSLFAVYLAQPILFHRRRHSADLASSVHGEMHDAALALASIVHLLADGLIVIAILVLLLLIAPWPGLAAGALIGLVGAVLLAWNHAALREHGHAYRDHQASKLRWVQQSLAGIKAIAISGRQRFALQGFAAHNQGSAAARARLDIIGGAPRIWLELLMVFAMVAIVLAMRQTQDGATEVIPALALFAAAGFRLLPSANRIVAIAQTLNFAAAAMQHVADELDLPVADTDPATKPRLPVLSRELVVRNVGLTFPGRAKPVLSGFDLTLPFGSATGLSGPSGSGKTTAIDVIAGLLEPDSGSVEIDGVRIDTNIADWHRQIGYAPQDVFLIDDTLRRNVALGVSDPDIDEAAVERVLRQSQLADFVASLPLGLDTVLGEGGARLSGGQRQRIGIARALYSAPRLLILDEPTSALDAEAEAGVIATIAELRGHLTVLVATHRSSVLRSCEQICRLGTGRVVTEVNGRRTGQP